MKGQITEVRFDATYNKGNYESEKIGLSYQLCEGECVFSIIEELRSVTKGQKTQVASKEEAKVTKPKEEKPKTEKKPEEPKVETTAEAVEEKIEVTEENKAEAKTEKKATKPKASSKATTTPYNRTNDIHKKRLAEFLDKAFPTWKTGENLKKSAAVSKELDGKEPFFDENGDILESFKEKFLAALK